MSSCVHVPCTLRLQLGCYVARLGDHKKLERRLSLLLRRSLDENGHGIAPSKARLTSCATYGEGRPTSFSFRFCAHPHTLAGLGDVLEAIQLQLLTMLTELGCSPQVCYFTSHPNNTDFPDEIGPTRIAA